MDKLIKINAEQRLYVLSCGPKYVSCLGFDVCEERKRRLSLELGVALAACHPVGSSEAYREYERFVAIAAERNRATGWRSRSELTPELIGLEGWRVEVVTSWGERQRFIVGKSCGFIPVHLAIAKRSSTGGPAVCGTPFQSVKRIERAYER